MLILFVLAGILFMFYGICLCVFSNLNLGVVSIVLMGVVFFVYGVFNRKINILTQKGVFRYLKFVLIFGLIMEGALIGFISLYGKNDNITYNEQAVIVLGAGIRGERVTLPLKFRLDKAIEYAEKNPEAIIVVSGGQGFQETATEAYAMEKYLIENGISYDRVIKEEAATSTNENMRFSKEILDEKFGNSYDIVVITNRFHIYRAVSVAHAEGFENVSHFHAGLQWYNILPCYLRESLAVLKMWIIG